MKLIKSIPSKNIYFEETIIDENNVPSIEENCVINIFDDITYQEILGFGGAFTESSAYNYSLMNDEMKKQFIKAYFDREEGIAYNLGRTHINSCDFSLDIYSYVKDGDKDLTTFNIDRDRKYIIPLLKDALKNSEEEMFLFASPWSPPAYMKDNESVIGGGSLKEEYKRAWAKYYAKYIKAYREEGINITAISVQNEPMAKQTWESCFYSPEDERAFIEKYIIPVFDEEQLSDIKIIIWDHNKERVYDRAKKILSNSKVNDRVWAVGHHWYTGDHFDGLRLVHEQLKKPLICSEFCGDIDEEPIKLAERYAKEMCGNFNNFETASCDWNLLLNTNGGPYHNRTAESKSCPGVIFESKDGGCHSPILYDKENGKFMCTPIYYYIGHMSKYVRKGAKRIATTKYTDSLSVCGFKNPSGEIVLSVYNTSDYEMPVVVRRNDGCTKMSMEPHSALTVIID